MQMIPHAGRIDRFRHWQRVFQQLRRQFERDQRTPLGLQIQPFRRHMLREQFAQWTEGFRLLRLTGTMLPPRTVDAKVAEQGLQAHHVASFLGTGFAAMRALAPALQIFRSLVFHYDLLHRRQQALALRQG
jgi:hypothetical protein